MKEFLKIFKKYLRKSSFFSKVAENELIVFLGFHKNLSNFVHVSWEDCFCRPMLLLTSNMLIYWTYQ